MNRHEYPCADSVDIDSKKVRIALRLGAPSGICHKIAFFRWNIGTDHDITVYIIINE